MGLPPQTRVNQRAEAKQQEPYKPKLYYYSRVWVAGFFFSVVFLLFLILTAETNDNSELLNVWGHMV